MPLWIFGILAIWWVSSLISYYQEDLDSEVVADSASRLTEPSWAIANELEDDPLWLQHLLLFDSSGGIYFDEDGINGLIYAITSAVIFARIAEEIVFRGFLFQSLERRGGFWAAALGSTFDHYRALVSKSLACIPLIN